MPVSPLRCEEICKISETDRRRRRRLYQTCSLVTLKRNGKQEQINHTNRRESLTMTLLLRLLSLIQRHVVNIVSADRPSSVHPSASTVKVCRQREMTGSPAQSPPCRVWWNSAVETAHSVVLTKSQATELATLARICTAPSTTHRMYEAANIVVQTELKQAKSKRWR